MPKCNSCDMIIQFQMTENGKYMPVEPGLKTVLTREGKTEQGFTPHHINCPGADENRKKRSLDTKTDK